MGIGNMLSKYQQPLVPQQPFVLTSFFMDFITKMSALFIVDDRMWNFDIRPKPKRSAKNRSIRPNIRLNISILINQVFEHLTKIFSRHNFTLTFFMYQNYLLFLGKGFFHLEIFLKTFFSEKIFRFFEYLLTNIAIFAQIIRPNIWQKPNVHSAE